MKSYYTLIASLPPLPRQFDDGPIPITASTLKHRVSMLDHEDQQVVYQLRDFFRWDRQPRDRSDAEVRATSPPFDRRNSQPAGRSIWSIIALRCGRWLRPSGANVVDFRRPSLPELPLSVWIRRNWDQPRFRLDARFRWLPRFCQALDEEQPELAKWHLFTELWSHWSRLDESYHFTFESFVLYLARWEILHRWASQDASRGQQRFDDLVVDILQSSGASF